MVIYGESATNKIKKKCDFSLRNAFLTAPLKIIAILGFAIGSEKSPEKATVQTTLKLITRKS
jgi:hypothetical protein